MTIRLLTFDELPKASETQMIMLPWNAFGGMWTRRMVAAFRRSGGYAPYVGLYAMEGDRLLAQMVALRIPYTTRQGTEIISGLSGVVTRADAGKRGLSRRLLHDLNAREQDDGLRLSLLWTLRSWYSHEMYLKEDYIDVYTPQTALRKVPRDAPGLPLGWELRTAKKADADLLDDLHRRAHQGYKGFLRSSEHLAGRIRRGMASASGFRILEHHDEPVAYAALNKGRDSACYEFVATSQKATGMLLQGLEGKCRGTFLGFGSSPLNHYRDMFADKGYEFLDSSWEVLMAKDYTRKLQGQELIHHLGCDSTKFTVQGHDFF